MTSSISLLSLSFLVIASCSPPVEEIIPYPECEQFEESAIEPVGFFDTEIQGYWTTKPNIRICPGAGISTERVKVALGFWKDIGYEFGEIIHATPSAMSCVALPGEIAIRLPTQREISEAVREGKLGVAKTSIDTKTKRIISSDIYFQNTAASHTAKIIEHEIGHALGWEHHNFSNHIMHRSLRDAGYGSVGVEKRRYDSLAEKLIKQEQEDE